MLAEASRILAPGGQLFVYTHVRKNARIARAVRAVNRLSGRLDKLGLVDLKREHLRKSDHLNPLADIPELEAVTAKAGFRIARITYYTPVVGSFVENILLRLAERLMARRSARRLTAIPGHAPTAPDDDAAVKEARLAAKQRLAKRGPTLRAVQAVSALMRVDLLLFGRVRSGPFFALLVKTP